MDPRSLSRAEVDDTERFRRMSPEERLRLFLELCDLTDAIVGSRPDQRRLRERHPRSAEALATWRRLMSES